MKTFYQKALIIGFASLLLEVIIFYFIYTSINVFYTDLTNKLAFLLVEQVKNVIDADRINISRLSAYNKYPIRRLMNRFSGKDSEILHILLIDTTNQIVISDDPSVEGKEYTSLMELDLLATDQPTVINRIWEGRQEILDVIYPLTRDNVKQGYLRTVISLKHLENFYRSRKAVLFVASAITLITIILTVFLTSRIYRRNLQNIEQALERLNESDYKYRVDYPRKDEFAPLFSRLNQLFEKTLDLNESFRQSEEKVKAMMQVIHEGLLIIDSKMKIISYNEYLLELLHIRSYRNPEKQINQIIKNNPKLMEIYHRARDPLTHAVRKQLSLKLLDGKHVDIQIHALPVAEGDNTNNIIFYLKNLAVLQELEQNLHRSMKYTVISQLASSIGHEIRNPLSSLAIHTEILNSLTRQLPTDPEHRQKIDKSVHILNSEIERLTKLIDQFFNLAKPKEIALTYENINNVIKEVLELIQQEAYEKSVRIHLRLSPELPLVNISKDQIKQVIINLILNAFDAMPNGGDLYLSTSEHENRVRIIVQDSGSGIPINVQEKIFDLYFSTKPNGGGIGLAISKRIIEAHEGQIYFKTKIGEGTRFIIELPRSYTD